MTLRALGLSALLAATLLALWPVWLQLNGNYHAVLPGELYRSAQPSAADLTRAVREDGIRSVLNLRGSAPDKPWYRAERLASDRLGLVHADFGMSASRAPSADDVARLVALMRSLPKPVLIHCRQGSDRSGFAAALYLAAIAGTGAGRAEGQLSFRYGHAGLWGLSPTWAMDKGFAAAERGLGLASR